MKKIVTALFITILLSKVTFPQFDDRFSFLGESEVKGFGKPLVTAFGIGLNTGAFHTAYVPRTFGFSIGLHAMIMMIPDAQKTFKPNLPNGYVSTNGKDETATIFGEDGGIYAGPQGLITYPSGINESIIPLAFPQVTVSFMGNELLLRYVPLKLSGRSVTLFGIGLKHSISQYIPFCPLDIAVQVMYNNFKVENLLKSDHLAFNAQASKTFGILTAYGGLQYESSKVKFEYDIKQDPNSGLEEIRNGGKVSAEVEGDNNVRLTVGAALNMAFFIINADYSLGSQNVASAGLTFEF